MIFRKNFFRSEFVLLLLFVNLQINYFPLERSVTEFNTFFDIDMGHSLIPHNKSLID